MAGLGRRVFVPGEVLTATNVMGYLQDQAVMNFAGTAARGSAIGTAVAEGMTSYLADNNFVQVHDGTAWRSVGGVQVASGTATRDALLPSPVQGDRVFRTDLGFEQTYYSAWGTANPGGRSAAGWYDNQRNMGLVPIVPPTVNISGGTATANSLGVVSFSAATSISFNNVFTATYSNYRIVYKISTRSAFTFDYFRLRNAGSDLSTSTYDWTKIYANTGAGPNRSQGAPVAQVELSAAYSSDYSQGFLEVINPANSLQTWGLWQYGSYTGSIEQGTGGFRNYNTTAYDGFTLFPSGGNFTGTIQVLGYNS